jgi:hypothetical protein
VPQVLAHVDAIHARHRVDVPRAMSEMASLTMKPPTGPSTGPMQHRPR